MNEKLKIKASIYKFFPIISIFINLIAIFILYYRTSNNNIYEYMNLRSIIVIILCILAPTITILSILKKKSFFKYLFLVITILCSFMTFILTIHRYKYYLFSKNYNDTQKEFVLKLKNIEKDFSNDVKYTVEKKEIEYPYLNDYIVVSKNRYENFIKEYNKDKPYSEQLISPFESENIDYCDGYVLVENIDENLKSNAYISCNNGNNSYKTDNYKEIYNNELNLENNISVYITYGNSKNGTKYDITKLLEYTIKKEIYVNENKMQNEYILSDDSVKKIINLLNTYDIENWSNNNKYDKCYFNNNSLSSLSIINSNKTSYYCINDINDKKYNFINDFKSIIDNIIEDSNLE